ncbi:hypothetical protein BJ742DRAFT_843862 [Cladochytrium replicatum]|nr:hypothetical protein BJ742DRAFT_843862 [Cladochytrium replicatum]
MNPALTCAFAALQDEFVLLKNITQHSEAHFESVTRFFETRHKVEAEYVQKLENVVFMARACTDDLYAINNKRPKDTALPRAWTQIADHLQIMVQSHRRLEQQLNTLIVQNLAPAKKWQKDELKQVRSNIYTQRQQYLKYRKEDVGRMRQQYERRCKELEQLEENNKDPSKLAKQQNDVVLADNEYRRGVIELENMRQDYRKLWERQSMHCYDKVERECMSQFRNAILTFSTTERLVAEDCARSMFTLAQVLEHELHVDYEVNSMKDDLGRAWHEPPPVHYFNHACGESKDLVFGVPLRDVCRLTNQPAPPLFLERSIKSIEKRGLEREGLYRISGKQSDIFDVRANIEKNTSTVLFDEVDVNVLASIVKMYLRQLPDPLFPFAANDRAELAKIGDSEKRLEKIKSLLKIINLDHLLTLKFVIEHLATIASKSDVNKMTPQNLALVFAPVIFGGQTESIPDVGSSGSFSGFLSKLGASKLEISGTPITPQSIRNVDISQFQSWKSDGIIETIIEHRDKIFTKELMTREPAVRGQGRTTSQNPGQPMTYVSLPPYETNLVSPSGGGPTGYQGPVPVLNLESQFPPASPHGSFAALPAPVPPATRTNSGGSSKNRFVSSPVAPVQPFLAASSGYPEQMSQSPLPVAAPYATGEYPQPITYSGVDHPQQLQPVPYQGHDQYETMNTSSLSPLSPSLQPNHFPPRNTSLPDDRRQSIEPQSASYEQPGSHAPQQQYVAPQRVYTNDSPKQVPFSGDSSGNAPISPQVTYYAAPPQWLPPGLVPSSSVPQNLVPVNAPADSNQVTAHNVQAGAISPPMYYYVVQPDGSQQYYVDTQGYAPPQQQPSPTPPQGMSRAAVVAAVGSAALVGGIPARDDSRLPSPPPVPPS